MIQATIDFSGPLRVTLDDGTDITPGSSLRQAILAVLTTAPGQIRARKALQVMFWASSDPARAAASLRSALYLLRKDLEVLESDWLRTDRLTVALQPGRLLAKGVGARSAPFLEGMDLSLVDCEGFEDWLREMRHPRAEDSALARPNHLTRPSSPVVFRRAASKLFPAGRLQVDEQKELSLFNRDVRIRWAFEEVGQPYDTRLPSLTKVKKNSHQKFYFNRQFTTLEESSLASFESGAIVLEIAERHAGLLPADRDNRSRAISWMFAAVSTVEPPIRELGIAEVLEDDRSWRDQHLETLKNRVHLRLGELSVRLGSARWLEAAFTAGDLLMISALSKLDGSDLLHKHENLLAYLERGQSRAPFKRAFEAQFAVFTGNRSSDRNRQENEAVNSRINSYENGSA